MFSWGDLYVLFGSYQYAAADIKNEVTYMLVAYPTMASAQANVYAISVTNWSEFVAAINTDVNNIVASEPKLTIASPLDDKIELLNKKLGKKYDASNNLEKVFLDNFGNHGISLYKANDDLTNWSRLTLGESVLNNGTVIETPCN